MRGCKRSHCYCVTVLVCRAAADADDAAAYDLLMMMLLLLTIYAWMQALTLLLCH